MDFFGTTHQINLMRMLDPQVYVAFPLVNSSWRWLGGERFERTALNETCEWVQAIFTRIDGGWQEADYFSIEAECYKMKVEPDGIAVMSEIKQMFGDTAEIVEHVSEIVQSGADTANAVIQVYTNYKAATLEIPPLV